MPSKSTNWKLTKGVAWVRDLQQATQVVQEVTGAVKMNYEIHGNTLPHLHVHLFPRYRGDAFEGDPSMFAVLRPLRTAQVNSSSSCYMFKPDYGRARSSITLIWESASAKKGLILRILVSGLAFYLILVALMFFMQRRLLYLPSRVPLSEGTLQAMGLQAWPGSSEAYRGFVSAQSADAYRGTVIVFHGNAGSARDRGYYVRALEPLGYRVVIAEYPGYGARRAIPVRPSLSMMQRRPSRRPMRLLVDRLYSGVNR